MPPFREYISQVGITPGRALVISPSTIDLGGVSGAIREVGQALIEAERAMLRVRDFRETTEASNFLFDKTNAIKALAENDIDFDSSRYELEIDKATADAAKTITSRLAKEEFLAKADRQNIATKWGIKNMFRDRQFEAARASISYNRKQVLDTVGAMDEAGTITAIDGYRKVLEEGVAKGVIYKEFADFDLKKFEKDVADSQANYHVLTNPEAVIEELKEGKEGMFAALPAEDRAKYMKNAERMIKTDIAEVKRVQNEAMISNRFDTIEKIASGEIDLRNEPDLIRNMGVQDFRLGEAMKNSALKKTVTLEKESSEVFLEFAKDVFESGTQEQITTFLINALDNPNISRDRLASLVYAAKRKGEELNRGEKKGFWSGMFDMITKVMGGADSTSVFIDTLKRSREENADDKRAEEIANEEVRRRRTVKYPWIKALSQNGEVRIFPDGVKMRFFPDGRIEDVK